MADCVFRFKKFTIWSDVGGFKVGTDACLLGAWATVESNSKILEIGTGTGVISLIIAQRARAEITAIDIDPTSISQARINVERAPFGGIDLKVSSAQDFSSKSEQFDHIICNPPFFQNSDKPESDLLKRAKHTDLLPPKDLFYSIHELLDEGGKASLIIPFQEHEKWLAEAKEVGLFLNRKTTVYPAPEVAPKRLLLEFGLNETEIESEDFFVEDFISEKRNYSVQYKNLLQDFYLRF